MRPASCLPARRGPVLTLAAAALAAVGAAIAFAPSWDSYTLRTAAGLTHTLTAGNSFANPAPVIAGDVAVMVTLVAVVAAAALWRPARLGAVLLAGAVVPDGRPGHLGSRAGQRARVRRRLRHLAGPGHPGRSHDQHGPHGRVLDLLRVRGGAAHHRRLDGVAEAPRHPALRLARGTGGHATRAAGSSPVPRHRRACHPAAGAVPRSPPGAQAGL